MEAGSIGHGFCAVAWSSSSTRNSRKMRRCGRELRSRDAQDERDEPPKGTIKQQEPAEKAFHMSRSVGRGKSTSHRCSSVRTHLTQGKKKQVLYVYAYILCICACIALRKNNVRLEITSGTNPCKTCLLRGTAYCGQVLARGRDQDDKSASAVAGLYHSTKDEGKEGKKKNHAEKSVGEGPG